MSKLIKILVTLIIVFGLLLVAAVVILPRVVDPNNYRDQIVKLVHDKTGMNLVIDGDIGMSVFPWLGLTTGQLILSDPDLADSPSLLQVKSSEIRVKLLPLLKKEIQADTVVLDGLKVNLVTEVDGKTNWAKLTGSGEPGSEEKSPAQAVVVFAVAGLEIKDGMFLWDDKKAGQNYLLSNLNLESGVIKPGKPATLHLTGNLSSTALPKPVDVDTNITVLVNDALNGGEISNFSLSAADQAGQKGTLKLAKADIDLEKQHFVLSGIDLDTQGLPVNGTLKARSADIDLEKQTVEVPDLSLDSDAGTAQLSASVKKLMATAPAVYSKFKLSHINLGKIMPLIGGEQPEILGQLKDINLSGSAGYDNDQVALNGVEGFLKLAQPGVEPLDILYRVNKADVNLAAQTLNVPDLSVTSDIVKLTASASGRYDPENPDLKGKFSLPGMNPKTLLKMLDVDVPTSDPKALTNVALNSDFHYTKSGVTLSSLKGKLDDTPINGSATIRLSPDLSYRFDLKLGKLNADRYMAPANAPATATPKPAATAAAPGKAAATASSVSGKEQLAGPIAFISTLDADGKIALEQLKVEGLAVDNILLGLKAKGGLVNMSPVSASLYQGKLSGDASFDARPMQPVIGAKLKLTDMQIGGLLKELNITDKLEAKGQASTDIRMIASEKVPLINTLSGPVTFALKDGLIRGFDLRKIILGAQELVNQTKYKGKLDKLAADAQGADSDEFRFTAMTGSVKFNRGVGHNEDLNIKSPLFRVTGDGDVDIPDSKIDYHMDVHVVESLKGQGGESLGDLRGADIPVRIHGKLEDPRFQVDLQRLLKRELEKKIDKEKEKYKEKLQEKLNKAIEKNIGGSSSGSGDQDAVRDLGKKLLDGLFK